MLLCDTSGRLHNNYELMEELQGCKAALTKGMAAAPHETLLVLDGTTGGPRLRLADLPGASLRARHRML